MTELIPVGIAILALVIMLGGGAFLVSLIRGKRGQAAKE